MLKQFCKDDKGFEDIYLHFKIYFKKIVAPLYQLNRTVELDSVLLLTPRSFFL